MTQRAIIIPYAVDQNAPSFPVREIFTLPDDEAERDEMLRNLFNEYVCDGAEQVTVEYGINAEEFGFDIIATCEHDVYMYVVFLPNL